MTARAYKEPGDSLDEKWRLAEPVALLIFEGDRPTVAVEEWLAEARQRMVVDVLQRAVNVPAIRTRLVVTNRTGLAETLADGRLAEVIVERPAGAGPAKDPWDYHFGQAFARVVLERSLQNVFYCGGGACPLISVTEIEEIVRRLQEEKNLVVTNNPYSADLVGFSPGEAISRIEPPVVDNTLPLLLHQQAGLRLVQLPRTLGINFDIDTPTDLMILAIHPDTGPSTREYLGHLPLKLERFEKVRDILLNPEAQVLVYGRVGAPLFGYLDEKTRCRLRLVSEERGMKARGRDERGEVVSLLGLLWQQTTPSRFFRCLADLADAAVLDTRVIFAHLFGRVQRADRFYSDLGEPSKIADPRVREFTQAALEAPIPVLLGGHSLVSGGLWALLDAAWRGSARPVLLDGWTLAPTPNYQTYGPEG